MSHLFRLHDPGQGHPERPARYDAVARGGRVGGGAAGGAGGAARGIGARPLTAYVDLIERFCAGGGGALDPDTIVNEASFGRRRCARRAALWRLSTR